MIFAVLDLVNTRKKVYQNLKTGSGLKRTKKLLIINQWQMPKEHNYVAIKEHINEREPYCWTGQYFIRPQQISAKSMSIDKARHKVCNFK